MNSWWTNLTQGQKQALDAVIFAAIFGVAWLVSKSWKAATATVFIVWLGSYIYHSVNNSNES